MANKLKLRISFEEAKIIYFYINVFFEYYYPSSWKQFKTITLIDLCFYLFLILKSRIIYEFFESEKKIINIYFYLNFCDIQYERINFSLSIDYLSISFYIKYCIIQCLTTPFMCRPC
ncbi:hypothetical protein BpHYR1_046686 [Brachionus plicatilis]|uniref:Uncharacterized protein n=1 Tax=Brachionus plicatilis TaxID=10195 RepID=A0A3M7RVF6_BRAPC|nr:hypothetical protein BpHYR1_046686 [Brachionus plicatilis]